MVELVYDFLNLLIGYSLKATAFSKVLPDQTMGVLIQSTLPGMIRVGNTTAALRCAVMLS